FYGQDTWRVTKILTLNYGLRMALIRPFHDDKNLMANFDYSKYDPAKRVVYYQPFGTGSNRRAQNPLTGEILPAPYIGAMVQGVGAVNTGMVVTGQIG